jgi:hypothetical protein
MQQVSSKSQKGYSVSIIGTLLGIPLRIKRAYKPRKQLEYSDKGCLCIF